MEERISRIKSTSVPGWLLKEPDENNTGSNKINTGFIRKTLAEISRVIQNDFLAEKYTRRPGLLQGVHPSVKLVTLLFYMIFSSLTHSILTLVFLASIGVGFAYMSGLNIKSFIKRVWLILPLVTLVLSLPAATNILIKGTPVLEIYRLPSLNSYYPEFPHSLYFSFTGILMVLKMVLRIGVSISFGYVLAMTTQWTSITKSLRIFKLPKLVVMLLDMTYRFIFVLCKASIEIFEARLLRTVGRISGRENRRFVSSGIASLFLKANYMGEEIFSAMLCRGYNGEPVSMNYPGLSWKDAFWAVSNMLVTFILIAGEFLYA